MMDEFEVNIDDDSSFEVAEQIIRLRSQCLKGQFDAVEDLRRRWQSRKGVKVETLFKKADDADQDTDWSDEDDDEDEDEEGDVAMDEAPALVSVPKEKPAPPEVDEEGFTKVTRKKR
jgi:pre-rRNA-processing protein TSR2